jgi:hypothetical protein
MVSQFIARNCPSHRPEVIHRGIPSPVDISSATVTSYPQSPQVIHSDWRGYPQAVDSAASPGAGWGMVYGGASHLRGGSCMINQVG